MSYDSHIASKPKNQTKDTLGNFELLDCIPDQIVRLDELTKEAKEAIHTK